MSGRRWNAPVVVGLAGCGVWAGVFILGAGVLAGHMVPAPAHAEPVVSIPATPEPTPEPVVTPEPTPTPVVTPEPVPTPVVTPTPEPVPTPTPDTERVCEDDTDTGCTEPPVPVGVTVRYLTEHETTALVDAGVPCWGDEAGTWSCWLDGAIDATPQGVR